MPATATKEGLIHRLPFYLRCRRLYRQRNRRRIWRSVEKKSGERAMCGAASGSADGVRSLALCLNLNSDLSSELEVRTSHREDLESSQPLGSLHRRDAGQRKRALHSELTECAPTVECRLTLPTQNGRSRHARQPFATVPLYHSGCLGVFLVVVTAREAVRNN